MQASPPSFPPRAASRAACRAMDADNAADAAEAARLALAMSPPSAESDTSSLMPLVSNLCKELPSMQPVLESLKATRRHLDAVRENMEALEALQERCTFITACVLVRCRHSSMSKQPVVVDVSPLIGCVEEIERLGNCCGGGGEGSGDGRERCPTPWGLGVDVVKEEIEKLGSRVGGMTREMGLADVTSVERKVDDLSGLVVSFVDPRGKEGSSLLTCETNIDELLFNIILGYS